MTYLKLITPTNLAEEKAKFFRSEAYSPQFVYEWDGELIEQYKQANPRLIPLLDALFGQDGTVIETAAGQYFDVTFRPEDVAFAKNLIQTVPAASNGTAKDVATLMAVKLKEMGIDYRTEIVNKHGFQCRPDHQARVIRVSQYLHLQFYPTESVVNHELVHIIRAINGQANDIEPQPDYLPTEEGLACLVQDRLLKQPSASAFQHALEYLAAFVSRSAGFREVYVFLREHGCDSENAWLRGIRQKFGLRDTSQPGGLMKSGMYFYHEQLLGQLDTAALTRLFVGKIPFRQLADYPTYSGALSQSVIEALLC